MGSGKLGDDMLLKMKTLSWVQQVISHSTKNRKVIKTRQRAAIDGSLTPNPWDGHRGHQRSAEHYLTLKDRILLEDPTGDSLTSG